jgi:NTE family protein
MFLYRLCFIFLFFALSLQTIFAEGLQSEKKGPKIGLVLSGGGARGLAHIGVLKAIEESGLRVDYIVGTSMGAIVGALYSIGYSAAELEKVAVNADWTEIFTDELSRRELPVEDKDRDGRYIRTFPVLNRQIRLPTGLIAGQRLLRFLSSLTWPVVHESDFSKFSIPFACLATDLEDGSPVVFHNGNLHEIIRASMSLPSIFVPVSYGERLFADGMLVRNLPAQDAVEAGAEFLIGVDVGSSLYSKEELNSLLRVMDQSVSFRSADTNERQRQLCELLVLPELDNFTATNFDDATELIKRGESAGRRHEKSFRDLALLQGEWKRSSRRPEQLESVEFFIERIEVHGLQKVDESFVRNELQLKSPLNLGREELLEAVDRVYATQFFETVTYGIEKEEGGRLVLVVKVREKSEDSFSFGLRYATDQDAAVLLNLTLRNYAWSGSKATMDLKLSANPELELRYLLFSGLTRRSGTLFRMHYKDSEPFYYDFMDVKGGRFRAEKTNIEALFGSKTSDDFFMGVGLRREVNRISSSLLTVGPVPSELRSTEYNVLFGILQIDTLDDTYFPGRGTYFRGLAENYHRNLFNDPLFSRYTAIWQNATPIGSSRSLLSGIKFGRLTGGDIPYTHRVRFGQDADFREVANFPGIRVCERGGEYLQAFMVGLQFELYRNRFLILGFERGGSSDLFSELFSRQNRTDFISASLGMKTQVGPVIVRAMYCDREKYSFQASLGYRF